MYTSVYRDYTRQHFPTVFSEEEVLQPKVRKGSALLTPARSGQDASPPEQVSEADLRLPSPFWY